MKYRTFIIYFIIALSFSSCQFTKVEFAEFNTVSKNTEDKFLNNLSAKDPFYSVLIFTENFDNDLVKIEQLEKTIYKGNINSDNILGLANVFRIDNRIDVKISDLKLNKNFVVVKNALYKYIYINKDNNKYRITYSNSLKPFL